MKNSFYLIAFVLVFFTSCNKNVEKNKYYNDLDSPVFYVNILYKLSGILSWIHITVFINYVFSMQGTNYDCDFIKRYSSVKGLNMLYDIRNELC